MTDILSSFVPRVVLKRLSEDQTNLVKPPEVYLHFAAVLYVNITASYTQLVKQQPKQIANTLNKFFNKLLTTIHAHGGDVVEFSVGDSVLAIWLSPATETKQMSTSVLLASQCAVALQHQLKNQFDFYTCITAGKISSLHVGGIDSRVKFVLSGEPLDQLTECMKRAQTGQMLISHDAWLYVTGSSHENALSVGMIKVDGKPGRKKKTADMDSAYLLLSMKQSEQLPTLEPVSGKSFSNQILRYCPLVVVNRKAEFEELDSRSNLKSKTFVHQTQDGEYYYTFTDDPAEDDLPPPKELPPPPPSIAPPPPPIEIEPPSTPTVAGPSSTNKEKKDGSSKKDSKKETPKRSSPSRLSMNITDEKELDDIKTENSTMKIISTAMEYSSIGTDIINAINDAKRSKLPKFVKKLVPKEFDWLFKPTINEELELSRQSSLTNFNNINSELKKQLSSKNIDDEALKDLVKGANSALNEMIKLEISGLISSYKKDNKSISSEKLEKIFASLKEYCKVNSMPFNDEWEVIVNELSSSNTKTALNISSKGSKSQKQSEKKSPPISSRKPKVLRNPINNLFVGESKGGDPSGESNVSDVSDDANHLNESIEDMKGFFADVRQISVISLGLNMTYMRGKQKLEKLQKVFSRLQFVLYQYGGEIFKFSVDTQGSNIIVGFGLTYKVPDELAKLAIRAALSVQESLTEQRIRYQIGISTGVAFCGDLGCKYRREFSIIGDQVNYARALMKSCDWDEIKCDVNTRDSSKLHDVDIKSDSPVSSHGEQTIKSYLITKKILSSKLMVGRKREYTTIRNFIRSILHLEPEAIIVESKPEMKKSRSTPSLQTDKNDSISNQTNGSKPEGGRSSREALTESRVGAKNGSPATPTRPTAKVSRSTHGGITSPSHHQTLPNPRNGQKSEAANSVSSRRKPRIRSVMSDGTLDISVADANKTREESNPRGSMTERKYNKTDATSSRRSSKSSHKDQPSSSSSSSSSTNLRESKKMKKPSSNDIKFENDAVENITDYSTDSQNNCIVIIRGASGIGKTKFLSEIVRTPELNEYSVILTSLEEPPTTTTTTTTSTTGGPYSIWRQILLRIFDVNTLSKSTEDIIRSQINDFFPEKSELAKLIPLLNSVIPLGWKDNMITQNLDEKGRKSMLLTMLKTIIETSDKEKKNRLIIVDNVQWADGPSLKMLSSLMSQLKNTCVVLSMRPTSPLPQEFLPILSKQTTKTFSLQPMSKKDMLEIFKARLNANQISSRILSKIESKLIDGIPLSAIELADEMINLGTLEITPLGECRDRPEMKPIVYNEIIVSQVQPLSLPQKTLIKLAAVIGREFPVNLLNHLLAKTLISFSDSQVNKGDYKNLKRKRSSRFMRFQTQLEHMLTLNIFKKSDVKDKNDTNNNSSNVESGEVFSGTYEFVKPELKEEVYSLIEPDERRCLHHMVFKWYEQEFSKDLEPYYATIAYHAEGAGEFKKSMILYSKAGRSYFKIHYFNETTKYLKQALKFDISSDDEKVKLLKVNNYRLIAESYKETNEIDKCIEKLNEALDFLIGKNDIMVVDV
eukprot:TRINITY_DN806_c1_g1_i1.p1 TRINITY_DN806_c1_g1~~TRINITY_DN806_c1_g1_i1.p1  ORF type:complete len:1549 (+),score=350.61 TRINITY_DN806_c1_g1_i1:29-4675(+)